MATGPAGVETLPHELLNSICSGLRRSDVLSLALSSKSLFHQCAPYLFRHVRVCDWANFAKGILPHVDLVESLTLRPEASWHAIPEPFDVPSAKFGAKKYPKLPNCVRFAYNPRGDVPFAKQTPDISIVLRFASAVTPNAAEALIRYVSCDRKVTARPSNLASLDVQFPEPVPTMGNLVKICGPTLRYLRAEFFRFAADDFDALFSHCSLLETLHVHCHEISPPEYSFRLVKGVPNLRHFIYDTQASDAVFLAMRLPKLEVFDFVLQEELIEGAEMDISELAMDQSLEEMFGDNLALLAEHILQKQDRWPSLKRLNVRSYTQLGHRLAPLERWAANRGIEYSYVAGEDEDSTASTSA